MPPRLQLVARTGHPDFLDLPWEVPLEEWTHERLVEVVRGIHRHVVRFVEYDAAPGPALYALKEMPAPIARREYGLLRSLAADEMPVVEAVGVVTDRMTASGEELEAVLITRHLDYSLPFRTLFARGSVPDLRRTAPRRGRRAPRPTAPGRLLLGRLLTLEHAFPPRRGRARRLPRRRRDRRAPPQPV